MGHHRCPATGCRAQVPGDLLACSNHWFSLPRPLRSAVWRAWRGGAGAGTEAHDKAVADAVRYLTASDH